MWAYLSPSHGELLGVVIEVCDCGPHRPGMEMIYHVDIEGQSLGFLEHRLRPRRPPAGNKEPLGRWADCPWRPPVKASA